jgi:Fatty acid desaturase
MFDYLKYLLSPVLISVHMWGMWHGGPWVWLGLGVLLAIMALDMCLPVDLSFPDQRFPWVYDAVVTMTILAGFTQLFVFSYLVGSGRLEDTLSFAGAFVGTAFYGFVVAAPPIHELFHRENSFMRGLGRIGLCLIFDPWRELTHVITHHQKVATPDDPDTARRGESIYRFFARSFSGQAREAFRLEREIFTKRGRTWWHPMNRWVRWTAGLVIFASALYAAGGTAGMLWTIGTALLGPRLLLEVFNYVNHYGLLTEHPGRFARRHTWNHLTPFVRILALEITNHAGHHENAYLPFYSLKPDATGPRQPHFFLCVLAAFVPPLWFAIIKPRLRDWDANYATPRERDLARAANRAAGWEDWTAEEATPTKYMAA